MAADHTISKLKEGAMPTTGTNPTPPSEILAEFRRQADAPVLPLIDLRLDAASKPRAAVAPSHGESAR